MKLFYSRATTLFAECVLLLLRNTVADERKQCCHRALAIVPRAGSAASQRFNLALFDSSLHRFPLDAPSVSTAPL